MHRVDHKGLLKNLILLLSTVFVLCLLIEVAFRFYLFGWDALSYEKVNSCRAIGNSGIVRRSPYPEVVCELMPNVHTYHVRVPFETNSEGLRDKEYQIQKPPNTFRVAVVGDSYVLPEGVRIEDSFHSLLEDRLNSERRGCSYEFINFAFAGYSLRQYWAVIRHKTTPYDPDLILIGFFPGNDYSVPPKRIFNRPYKPKRTVRPFYGSFVWKSAKKLRRYLGKSAAREELATGDQPVGKINYIKDIFSQIAEHSRQYNIPVLVVHLAIRPTPHQKLEDVVTSNGLYFLDVSYLFDGKKTSDYYILPNDSHPNAKANKIFADCIYHYLDDSGLLRPNRLDDTHGSRAKDLRH